VTLLEAYKLAAQLHAGQVDKAGRPAIEHLTRVMLRVQSAAGTLDQQIAALLHDSLEDGKATMLSLEDRGVPKEVTFMVADLSRLPGEPYLNYIVGVKAQAGVVLIKLADLADNMDPDRLALLPDDMRKRLEKKYSAALAMLKEK
jgi:(p)ppGpp synthase/HD superfamily hydrolase